MARGQLDQDLGGLFQTLLFYDSYFIFQEAQAYADDNSLLFMETSAKTSMNVNEIFMAIGEFMNILII